MNQVTKKTLQDLAEITQLLQQCELRLKDMPTRFKTIYIELPPHLLSHLSYARSNIQTLAEQIVSFHNLPLSSLMRYFKN